MTRRIHQVKFRLDDEELRLLRQKLRDSDLSMAEYFRSLIVEGEIKTLPPELMQDIRRQVRGVGRNINQMARLAHISGKVSNETLRKISDAQEKIERQIERLAQWRF